MPASSNPATRIPASPSTKSFMARKIECYADTSAWIAFLDRSDSYHSLFRRLFSDPPPLVTSALVVADAHGLAVMRERRIATCWSTDRHMGLTGVRLAAL